MNINPCFIFSSTQWYLITTLKGSKLQCSYYDFILYRYIIIIPASYNYLPSIGFVVADIVFLCSGCVHVFSYCSWDIYKDIMRHLLYLIFLILFSFSYFLSNLVYLPFIICCILLFCAMFQCEVTCMGKEDLRAIIVLDNLLLLPTSMWVTLNLNVVSFSTFLDCVFAE